MLITLLKNRILFSYNVFEQFFFINYIITHGIAQHKGKQTGTTAAPDLLELFDLLSASYSYLPLAFAYPPY